MTMSCDDGNTSAVQRFEVFTGAGRRREFAVEVGIIVIGVLIARQLIQTDIPAC